MSHPFSTHLQRLLVDPSHVNEYSGEMTPLLYAAMSDLIEYARPLVKFGADTNLKVTSCAFLAILLSLASGIWIGKTAMQIAEECGYDEVVELLSTDLNLEALRRVHICLLFG